jgi:hypothetical protein
MLRCSKRAQVIVFKQLSSSGNSQRASEVLKHGLSASETDVLEQARRKPYEIFRQLDLGAGGYAIAPARDAKSALAEVIRRKHSR